MRRREFLKAAVKGVLLLAVARAVSDTAFAQTESYLRPPGAVEEKEFLSRCIRCFRCGQVCPTGVIKFLGTGHPFAVLDTPYLMPRDNGGCILCMRCNNACPSGALERLEPGKDLSRVKIGAAEVDKRICYSWNAYAIATGEGGFERIPGYPGRTCGLCVTICPLKGKALRAGSYERPLVDSESCVGCGLCESICPVGRGSVGDATELLLELSRDPRAGVVLPAIRVVPRRA